LTQASPKLKGELVTPDRGHAFERPGSKLAEGEDRQRVGVLSEVPRVLEIEPPPHSARRAMAFIEPTPPIAIKTGRWSECRGQRDWLVPTTLEGRAWPPH